MYTFVGVISTIFHFCYVMNFLIDNQGNWVFINFVYVTLLIFYTYLNVMFDIYYFELYIRIRHLSVLFLAAINLFKI